MCAERGVSVVIGAPYASGILVRGPQPRALYNYRPAKPEIIAKAERIAAVCRRHDVPLAAAALQFPFGHPKRRLSDPGAGRDGGGTPQPRLDASATSPMRSGPSSRASGLIRADAPTPRFAAS